MHKLPSVFLNYDEWEKMKKRIILKRCKSIYAYIKELILEDLNSVDEGNVVDERLIIEFNKMAQKAAEHHKFVWCVKLEKERETKALKGHECLSCPEFIMNEGECNPLNLRKRT